MSKLGYTEKIVNGKLYYFSDYSAFSTPHKSKIERHVVKKRAIPAARTAKKPVAPPVKK